MTIEDIDRTANFVDDKHNDVIIKVIGVGGGGDNAVNHMYEQGIKKVSFVVCNTDRQALNNSVVPNRLLIGPNTTGGLGAGNNPEVARQAAEESAEDIARLFDDETKMVFITAGMGGGTGTGAGPVVARIAQEKGLLTIGIVTIPFFFEGEKKIYKALKGAEEMSKYVDALLVVNNEQLTEIYPDLDWLNAFGKADDTLSNAARSISELITCDGHINLDFNDVNTTLRNGGAAIISTGYGEGEHRVTKAIQDALNSPLLKNKDIFGSKHLLFNLYYSREADQKFLMGEANELTSFIQNIDKDVDVIYGIGFDESLGNKIKITILAAGFELSIMGDTPVGGERKRHSNPFESPKKADETDEEELRKEAISKAYGDEKVQLAERERAASKYIILRPDQLEDDSIIETFEHSPAYGRDKRIADEVRQASGRQPATQQPPSGAPETPRDEPERPHQTYQSDSKRIEF
ncbi:MAG: cell division protein FtsZ [Muribaculaceae bacterium]|nr:cell division protein FtsZ [Muribaculaceae bacterium]